MVGARLLSSGIAEDAVSSARSPGHAGQQTGSLNRLAISAARWSFCVRSASTDGKPLLIGIANDDR